MTEAEKLLSELADEEIFEESEVFQPVDGYNSVPYSDENIINISNKSIGDISGQIVISGESYSQYVAFERDRYMDGIDLTQKIIQIHYERQDGVGDNSPAVNVTASDTKIRYGWVIPDKACALNCVLKVMPFAYGTQDGHVYVQKELYAELKVNDGLSIDGGIEEPPEEWYTQFLEKMETYLSQAHQVKNEISAIAQGVESSKERVEQAETNIKRIEQTIQNKSEQSIQAIERAGIEQTEEIQQQGAQQVIAVQQVAKDLIDYEALFPIVIKEEQEGTEIHAEMTTDFPFIAMSVYGKTTQDGLPMPENPIPPTSKGDKGTINIYSFGENVCDIDAFDPSPNTIVSRNGNGIRIVCSASAGTYRRARSFFRLKPFTTYTVSANINIATGKAAFGVRLKSADDDSYPEKLTHGSGATITSGIKKITFTTDKDKTFCMLDMYANFETAIDADVTFTDIMFNEGSTILPWETYKGQTATLQTPNGLLGIPVSNNGNYTDVDGQQWVCDEIDLARGKYVQRVTKQIFNGTETWTKSSVGDNLYYTIEDRIKRVDEMSNYAICDQYRYHGVSGSKMEDKTFKVNLTTDNAHMLLYINNSSYSKSQELKAALAENPVTVLYMLEAPAETELTPEEIAAYKALRTKEYTTNIWNDESAHMHVKYALDTKKYIDAKIT